MISPITTDRVMLPGEPDPMERSKQQALEQAKAKCATIVALWDGISWATSPQRRYDDEPCAETLETLRDYDIWHPEDDDDTHQGLQDGIYDAICNLPLGRATVTGTWIDGEEPQAESFKIPLCFGGPNVYLCGDYDHRGNPDPDSIEFRASWYCPEVTLQPNSDERDACLWALEYWLS